MAEGQRKGTIATQANHGKGIQSSVSSNNTRTIDEIGLTRQQSSAFQQIASIPEEKFEEFIEEKKAPQVGAHEELNCIKNFDASFLKPIPFFDQ